jgi:hypothetical protein
MARICSRISLSGMGMWSLFHKIAATSFTNCMKMKLWIWVLCLLWVGSICLAQEPKSPPTKSQGQEGYSTYDLLQTGQQEEEGQTAEESQPTKQEPIPVPIDEAEDIRSLGGQTFADDVFQSKKNRWGFSLSAYEAYASDISQTNTGPRESDSMTAFIPRTFFNFGKRKSQFHIDVGAGYRRYNKHQGLSSWDYYGGANYSYLPSKKSSLQIADQLTSSYNDAWSFVSIYSPINYNPNFSNEVLFNRQRITRNSLTGTFSYQINKRSRFGVFGGYSLYKYEQRTLGNADAFQVGANLDFRITDWLHLTNSYSAYLNRVDERFRDARIHNLQIGGFDFHLSRSWRLWLSGGIGVSDYEGENRLRESANAGVGYTSINTLFSVTYQHGFTSAIGLSKLLFSDIVSATYGHRLIRWMSANLQSYYYRSYELDKPGLLETFSGGGGLQFALRRDLVASVNSYYQNQRTHSFSVQGLELNRFSAYVGLQYMWPSIKREGYQ